MAASFVTFQLVKVAAYTYYKKSDSAGAVALRNFVGNNTFAVEAKKAEESLRGQHPKLLHLQEEIILSFQSSQDKRDHSYLTSHRILLLDTKGGMISSASKRHNYKSIPYGSIQAFSLQTNGVGDTILSVWSAGQHHDDDAVTTMAFAKGQVELWQVQQFMNLQVLRNFQTVTEDDSDVMEPANLDQAQKDRQTFLEWLADKNKTNRMDDIQERLTKEFPILLKNEAVDVAYPDNGGMSVLTNHRLLSIEVQKSMMDTIVEIKTILWPCSLQALKVQTQLDAEKRVSADLTLYTNIGPGLPTLHQCHKKSTGTDRKHLVHYLIDKLLAGSTSSSAEIKPSDLNASLMAGSRGQEMSDDSGSSWFDYPKNKPLDANEMTTKFSSVPSAILQPNEKVEMAFQGHKGGVMILFTPLRIVRLDPQATKGGYLKGAQQASYLSIPWRSIVGFGVRTAGGFGDDDAEVLMWTEMEPDPKKSKLSTKREPGMAYWELEFSKNLVDIIVLKKYLAQRCFAAPSLGCRANVDFSGSLHPQYHQTDAEKKDVTKLEGFLKNETNNAVLDAVEVDTFLHQQLPILLDEETVAMAWRAGRDICVFTNGRVLLIDFKGWNNMLGDGKVEYKSIPYSSIRGFSVGAKEDWQSHTELRLYTRNPWTLGEVIQDFGETKKSNADLVKLQQFLTAILFGGPEDVQTIWDSLSSVAPTCKSSLESTMRRIPDTYNNQKSKDDLLVAMTRQLTTEFPILLGTEVCEQVMCNDQCVFVYTNLRVLVMDWTTTSLSIKNLPFRYVSGYEIETAAGNKDPDAEVYITSDLHRGSSGNQQLQRIKQNILTKEGDVMEMGQYLTNKILF